MKAVRLTGAFRIRGDMIDVVAHRGGVDEMHRVRATLRSTGDGLEWRTARVFSSGMLSWFAKQLNISLTSDS